MLVRRYKIIKATDDSVNDKTKEYVTVIVKVDIHLPSLTPLARYWQILDMAAGRTALSSRSKMETALGQVQLVGTYVLSQEDAWDNEESYSWQWCTRVRVLGNLCAAGPLLLDEERMSN